MRFQTAAFFLLASSSLLPRLLMGGEAEFLQLVAKVEADVLEMAREVERLYKDRCSDETLRGCHENNYEECLSSFPNPVCPEGAQLTDAICGDGTTCSRLLDYSTSRVSLPEDVADGPNRNPTDPEVIETICFSQKLDNWFVEKNQQVSDYWKNFGLETPPMFFGAHNGVFRIYPGFRASECGAYDPRLRPYYVAASSGPKNILMILDVSGSMDQFDKLARLKTAAKRVVSTLTVADRIAVVPFETQPRQVIAQDEMYMYTATEENKNMILDRIDALKAAGQTNFYDAFKKGLDIFNATLGQESHVNCNSAVLFLTDGKMTDGPNTETEVLDYIRDRTYGVEERLGHRLLMFTYSVSEDASVDTFPRELACTVKTGVWSKIETEDEIIDSLSSYYQLFALGLGTDRNEDFTAWVEPYEYATGGIKGTTVAAPVYDHDKDPPLFLGVVGFDLRLLAINIALGGGDDESLDRIIRQSTAKCPALELTTCQLESFRRRGSAGDEALCTTNCTQADFVDTEPIMCEGQHDYTSNLWANMEGEGLSYEEGACCHVGETTASKECPVSSSISSGGSSNVAVIVGVAAGVVCVLLLGGFIWYKKRHVPQGASDPKIRSLHETPPIPPPQPSHNPEYKASAPVEELR